MKLHDSDCKWFLNNGSNRCSCGPFRVKSHDGPHDECDCNGPHVHDEDWNAFWDVLSEAQRQWLRDKANWEHMSLSAIATEWGVPQRDDLLAHNVTYEQQFMNRNILAKCDCGWEVQGPHREDLDREVTRHQAQFASR